MVKTKKILSFLLAAVLASVPISSIFQSDSTVYAAEDANGAAQTASGNSAGASGNEIHDEEEAETDPLSSYIKGTVLKLQDNVLVDTDYALAPDVNVIDLNGFTLRLRDHDSDNDYDLIITGDVQITDSSESGDGRIECRQITVENASVLFKNGRIKASLYGFNCGDNSSIKINGGTVNAVAAALISSDSYGSAYLEVDDGTLSSDGAAVFIQTPASLLINGGVLNGGIGIRMGNVQITGGQINSGTDTDSIEKYFAYLGSMCLPDALYVIGGVYDPGKKGSNTVNISISGGTFNGSEHAVAVYDLGAMKQEINLSITGGTFNVNKHADSFAVVKFKDLSIGSTAVTQNGKVDVMYDSNGTVSVEGLIYGYYDNKVTAEISGGYFSSRTSDEFIADGYALAEDAGVNGYAVIEQTEIQTEEHVHTPQTVKGTDPSCLDNGLSDGVICSECGEILKEQEVIPATGHNYQAVSTVDATCNTDGSITYKCLNCGDSYTDTIPATGDHTVIVDKAVAATCTENGKTSGTHCSVCGEILEEQELVPATGHDYKVTSFVDATCGTDGSTTYKCSNCGDSYTDTIPATGEHTVVEDKAVAATCTESGLTSGSHCSVCGQTLQAQTEVPATGHTVVIDQATDTLTEGSHCSVCGEILVAQQTIHAASTQENTSQQETDSSQENENSKNNNDSQNDGNSQENESASSGGNTSETEKKSETSYTSETESTEHQHTIVIDEAVPATCTETGLTEGQHCSVCNAVIVAQEVIPATGHAEVVETGYDATCTSSGLTDLVYCSVCGTVLQEAYEIPLLDHTVAVEPGIEATCTEDGLTDGEYCSVCGEILKEQEVIPAVGHVEVIDEAVEPTCTEEGLTEGSHCSQCGEILQMQESIDALGHTPVDDPGYDATCTENGLTDGSHCSVCGEIIEAQIEIPATGHDFEWIVDKEATTEEGGYRHQVCTVCGEEGEIEIIPMIETVSQYDASDIAINTEAVDDAEDEYADSVQTDDPTPVLMWSVIAAISFLVMLGTGGYTFFRARKKIGTQ